MYGYIYKTTNLVNGKIYIGQKKGPEFYPDYKGSGKALWNAIRKYGWDKFKVEFLIPCFSQEELDAEEIFLIDWFGSRDRSIGYNISEGGTWGDVSLGMTPEEYQAWCDKNRASHAGEKNHFYGKRHTEESKRKISEHHADFSGENNPNYGKRLSESTRAKISEAARGRVPWNKGLTKDDPRVKKYSSSGTRNKPGRIYHLICKSCGSEFESTASNKKRCPACNGSTSNSI